MPQRGTKERPTAHHCAQWHSQEYLDYHYLITKGVGLCNLLTSHIYTYMATQPDHRGYSWLPNSVIVGVGGAYWGPHLLAHFPVQLSLTVSLFPFLAWGRGDPHIKTLDGRDYTFNGWGEYLLSRIVAPVPEFYLQGRTSQLPGTQATEFTAFCFGNNMSSVMVRKRTVCKTIYGVSQDA